MKAERRKDYRDLAETINANDIKHMKETLDEIKDNWKEFLNIYREDKKEAAEDKIEISKLKLKMKWVMAVLVAFFTGIGTIALVFGKKIIAAVALLIP